MDIAADQSSLIKGLDARAGGVRHGKPPVALYWLYRRHGATIAALATAGKSYRLIKEAIANSADAMTVRNGLNRMRDPDLYRNVACSDWEAVEKVLFSRFPGYQSMAFYRTYIATGDSGYAAWIRKCEETKRRKLERKGAGSKKGARARAQSREAVPAGNEESRVGAEGNPTARRAPLETWAGDGPRKLSPRLGGGPK